MYVLGTNWPRVGVWTGDTICVHLDQGLVWEIDTSTYAVNPDIGVVGTEPKTIYYVPGEEFDKLFIYTTEGTTDVINLVRGFPRVA